MSGHQMSEADLMVALNEALQRAGEDLETWFCRVRYAPSGAISALLIKKANAGSILPRLSNVLIRAAKTVDAAVIGVEILEHWQRLKVHGMSLERYLREGSMELLRREVESSTGIQLKALPYWLINKSHLREQQETGMQLLTTEQKNIVNEVIVENQKNLTSHLYCMILDLKEPYYEPEKMP